MTLDIFALLFIGAVAALPWFVSTVRTYRVRRRVKDRLNRLTSA